MYGFKTLYPQNVDDDYDPQISHQWTQGTTFQHLISSFCAKNN